MKAVKNPDFKKKYLKTKFLKRIMYKCENADYCYPFSEALINPYLWGFHHALKDDKGNRRNYPDVIDSLFFMEYLPNCCHTNCARYPLKHITPYQAGKRQETLNKPKWKKVKNFVNGITGG